MRYSTVFKFIAFVLCAAALLGMVGSAAGIFFLTELGGKSVEESYRDQLRNQSFGYAASAGSMYVSESLGGTPRNLINQYFGNDWQTRYFDWSRVGYALYGGEGDILQEVELPDTGCPVIFEEDIAVTGKYMKVIATTPREEYQNNQGTAADRDIQVRVMPGQEAVAIGEVFVGYTDGNHEVWLPDGTQLGILQYTGGDTITFLSNIGELPIGDGWYPNNILMYDMGGNVVYEVYGDSMVLLGSSLDGDDGVIRWFLPAGTITTAAPVGVTIESGDYKAYDAIPAQGVTVTGMNVTYANAQGETVGSEGVSSPDLIGTLFHDGQGNAMFRSMEPMTMDIPDGCIITCVTFMDAQNNALFEASCPAGVGIIEYDVEGCLLFKGRKPGTLIPEAPVPIETEVPDVGESRTGFAMEEISLYSAPSKLSNELGKLAAWQEVEILKQGSFNGEGWGLTEAGWIPMDKVLLGETAAATGISEAAAEETIAAETEATEEPAEVQQSRTVPEVTEAAAGLEAAAATEPEMYPAEAVQVAYYYDETQKREMAAQYIWENIPAGYTMKIRLAQGAMRNELGWTLLRLAEVFRGVLLETLGICIAVFALCVVHLCCSAGRTRRNNEVRAGGLNRIPLDLYLGLGALAETGLVFAAVEGSEHFARNDQQLALIFCGACAYLACLVLVGFFFAFVAQTKTPGGYWWRNSLCGRCLKLVVRIWKWLLKMVRKMAGKGIPTAGSVAQWLWDTGKRLTLWAWDAGKRLATWGALMIRRMLAWLTARLVRFFGLLPITWQFLLTGFTLVFLLYVVLRSYKIGWILVGFGLFFATILYAASAFAILLDSAKRMSRGDLDTKVDDRMLIGGFRDFAGELNDLADVAVVAAQKQLKSERMKTELITNVSHDIKTPLTSIINYVDLMQKPHTEEEQTQYLEVLDRQSQRLKKLIDDLMEMSKASTGNMTVEIGRVDAGEAVNQALGEFADKLERAQLIPVFRQPEEQICMMADGRLVWRVMSNLLGNAVKYALPGTRIYMDLMEVDGKVIISMKNISREELNIHADELLERFVRGDASRNTEGSGLGLNIAQSLMELQKGQLQILVDGDLFKVTLIFPAA